jgi:hypothetical protein
MRKNTKNEEKMKKMRKFSKKEVPKKGRAPKKDPQKATICEKGFGIFHPIFITF